nr:dynein light chain [Hymenolepis microstoma]
MAELENDGETTEATKGSNNYPLVNYSDMNEELTAEISEMCVTACEKFPDDNGAAAKMVKKQFEQKAGLGWQVVIGQGFGFEITHDLNSVILLYVGGNTGVLIWKCG